MIRSKGERRKRNVSTFMKYFFCAMFSDCLKLLFSNSKLCKRKFKNCFCVANAITLNYIFLISAFLHYRFPVSISTGVAL